MALYSCIEDCVYTVVNVYIHMYSILIQTVTTRQFTAHLSTFRLSPLTRRLSPLAYRRSSLRDVDGPCPSTLHPSYGGSYGGAEGGASGVVREARERAAADVVPACVAVRRTRTVHGCNTELYIYKKECGKRAQCIGGTRSLID